MLVKIDQITSYCATSLIVDSKTQKNFLIKNKIINDRKSVVLGKGSISGVDTKKFQPNKKSRSQIRKKFKVKKDQIIYLYLGRINEDKGILFIRAFNNCLKKNIKLRLWIVGHDEENIKKRIRNKKNIKFFPYTNSPEKFMQAADIFCLPSKREGFGTSIIEAGSCCIPTIGSRIYGITDSLLNGKTGLLHKVDDIRDMTDKMNKLANNKNYVSKCIEARRVIREFDQKQASINLLNHIKSTSEMIFVKKLTKCQWGKKSIVKLFNKVFSKNRSYNSFIDVEKNEFGYSYFALMKMN